MKLPALSGAVCAMNLLGTVCIPRGPVLLQRPRRQIATQCGDTAEVVLASRSPLQESAWHCVPPELSGG